MGSAFNYKMWRSFGWFLETTLFFFLCFFWYIWKSHQPIRSSTAKSTIPATEAKILQIVGLRATCAQSTRQGSIISTSRRIDEPFQRGWNHRSLLGPLGAIDRCHLGEGGGKILQMGGISGSVFFGELPPQGFASTSLRHGHGEGPENWEWLRICCRFSNGFS